MVGPNLQQDIFSIILRFRTHRFVITADIAKFYRQIWISPEDRKFQQIFWRENQDCELLRYQLKTVTYGTASASYLATKCLHQVAHEMKNSHPLANAIITTDFYVDDLLTGANSIEEVTAIKDQVSLVLNSAGFELRQWASNEPSLISHIEPELNCTDQVNIDKQGEMKTLGLNWNCVDDKLQFKVNIQQNSQAIITKRSILSKASQLFDPLGLIGPILIIPKILIQKLWILKLDWDSCVPENIAEQWLLFLSQLGALEKFQIPRMITPINTRVKSEIHGFADASETAYGCAVYLKTIDINGDTKTCLICSKSRVAPLKTQSIPRLELCAALLLTKTVKAVKESLRFNVTDTLYWTDSQIVLAWLQSDASKWKTFVANRVSKIQTLSGFENWRHVRSKDNPADIISRGALTQSLLDTRLWWEGPSWLNLDHHQWPSPEPQVDSIPEQRKVSLHVKIKNQDFSILKKYSHFSKLIRVIAYILRFICNCKGKDKLSGHLKCTELDKSSTVIMRLVQLEAFEHEIKSLRSTGVAKTLLPLNAFLDSESVIRVGGRLSNNTRIPYDKRHPIVLLKNHHVTQIIVRDIHIKMMHAGHQATLAAVRDKYWPIAGNYIVRRVLKSCVVCFKAKPRIINQIMGNLPYHRIEPSRPFTNCGVDYCGPLLIKEARGRGKRTIKSYVAIFVCFATKAIHLELVLDCTTESFLAALRRFISRRGMVSNMYSDNATNFVGADRELRNLLISAQFETQVMDKLTNNGITWHFIPANSPHHGGLWESGVKIVKKHLNKTTQNALMTYEEMYTVLTQIEAIVNSRPITPLSSDPEDLQALTPAHFLIGQRMTSIVEPDLTSLPTNRLSRWEYVQQVRQHFWKRWNQEYLTQLQQRSKWRKGAKDVPEGAMVLLVDKNHHPFQWKMGRVVKTHPGLDNVVRVVTVKTATGVFVRSISKLAFLPSESEQ